ncbi:MULTISPECIES: pantoate--beta-alanine ligase [Marivita]|uniref:Pantothenate synthetase n=1 Tax=Marivita cryptomonadis TaxID=505252 RepID=A0A9Q2P363_9RHOB|nr:MULTISPECIES: pantoate--beta-alanine ligase [Marivita]MCR9168955.1 pantoate--beta-alanine ligase [Paracoccaceae bacterium]MBM2321614.1 pantoate--beta-alanine ligase [Marivita cryptomonadis]MBM2331195.1 pantoate--beta-alanine ligase [Marivita cryptomonadis]MBM2340781.1 pantoate--beta-alanine ligase [Marivita cryptomonadis]MBM2345443.1 pantoate--beta-alanine ligase [Marivita cryptomonadis]
MIAPIVRDKAQLREIVTPWKRADEVVGVVPTMGALHDGHLSLVAAAKAVCDRVIVTIFVNPKQFNNPEDLANYPRTEEADGRKLERFGVDAIWVPDGDQMYPEGFATTVSVSGVTDCLCGTTRPGHFEGVATVVAKLFLQTQADKAFFGEKDYQQLQVVARMAADLDIPIQVIGCPTIREEDGLAMSSRNLLLSDRARVYASVLYEVMEDIAEALRGGATMSDVLPDALARLNKAGFTEVDYLELRTADGLDGLERADVPGRLFAAAWLAGVRLIDNIAV